MIQERPNRHRLAFAATLYLFASSGAFAAEAARPVKNIAPPASLPPLALFNSAFQKVRDGYADKVDDSSLLRNAALGVLGTAPAMKDNPATGKIVADLRAGSAAPAVNNKTLDDFSYFLSAAQSAERDTDDRIVTAAIEGMLRGLDNQSIYIHGEKRKACLPPDGGIGVQLKIENGSVKVVRPLDSSPALEAGIKSGDILTHAGAVALNGLSLDEVVAKLCGPIGSAVAITLIRGDESPPVEVKVTRRVVSISARDYIIFEDVAWIRIRSFEFSHTSDWLKYTMVWNIKAKIGAKLKGYILDLRDNRGGVLEEAIKTASAFLESGTIVLVQGRNSIERKVASGGDLAGGKPVVVLINANSAAGAEIVASCLQDARRAVIAGRTSSGAGTVQTLIPLDSQHAIKLTTAKLLRASGQSWDGKGVRPDIVVEAAPQTAVKEEGDRDLAAALYVLRQNEAAAPRTAPLSADAGTGIQNQDYDRMIAAYTKSIENNPAQASAYQARGAAYYRKKDFDRAAADYNKAIALDPQLASAYIGRGSAYYAKNDYDRAIADYSKAIELDPKQDSAYLARANAYFAKGNIDEASADFGRANSAGHGVSKTQ
jgi:carboxyl-terminal processing protease